MNNEQFGIVSKDIMLRKGISPQAKAIYALLTVNADTNGCCCMSTTAICAILGLGEESFYKHMKKLKKAGVVEVIRQKNGNKFAENMYQLTCYPTEDESDTEKTAEDRTKIASKDDTKGSQSGECVSYVYTTNDYERFNKLHGNREVLESRKMTIITSIRERGWIRNPIVVNEKMEIIDGQGRFEALKELQMAIEYVVAEGATVDDCIALNLKQNNWKTTDYINCYAEHGNENYVELMALLKKYPKMSEQTVTLLAGEFTSDGSGQTNKVKNGKFIISDKDLVYSRIEFTMKCLALVGKGNGRERHWSAVFKFIHDCPEIDSYRFLDALHRHKLRIMPAINSKTALENMEKIYNYGKGSKTYFAPLWDDYSVKKTKLRAERQHGSEREE